MSEGNPEKLSKEQMAAKAETDKLLETLLAEHRQWVEADRPGLDHRQLSWRKLRSVFDLCEAEKLGLPTLTGHNFEYADFSGSMFPEGTDFSNACLFAVNFSLSTFSYVNFSGCLLSKSDFTSSNIRSCNFSNATLDEATCSLTTFIDCRFIKSYARNAKFDKSFLEKSIFCNATLYGSNFRGCISAANADFTEANLSSCMLVGANFSKAKLTGANLYGTARSNWRIDRAECDYVYWDEYSKHRFPPENDFEEGEFETQYREYKRFSHTFKEGMTPLDLMLADQIVSEINKADLGFEIKVDNASILGLNPTLNFVIISGADKVDEVKELYDEVCKLRIENLENQLINTQQLLGEREKRAELAENQLVAMNDLLSEKDSFNLTTLQHFFEGMVSMIEQSQPNGFISMIKDTWDQITADHPLQTQELKCLPEQPHTVLFNIPARTVQVDSGMPIHIGSVREFSALWAIVETNDRASLCRNVQTLDVFESALRLETVIRRPNDRGSALTDQDEDVIINSAISQLRKKAKLPAYNDLLLLIPAAGTKRICMNGWDVQMGVERKSGEIDFNEIANLLR